MIADRCLAGILLFLLLPVLPGALFGADDAGSNADGAEAGAVLFQFSQSTGDQYRIVSEVDQTVLINGEFDRQARILNRIAVKVLQADKGGAHLEVTYQTSEKGKAGGDVYQWASEDTSRFYRRSNGRYEIPRKALVPSIRHIPTFPRRKLRPGDTWTAPAVEVHPLEAPFGIDQTLRIPLEVSFRYAGAENREGKRLHRIEIAYQINYQPDLPDGPSLRPKLIQGLFQQEIWWNAQTGRPQLAEEEYKLAYLLSSGDVYRFEGTSRGEVAVSRRMERQELAEDIQRSLDSSGMEGARAEAREEGVRITVEDLHFKPDKAVLRSEEERRKLETIAEILREHPDRDIQITGHTARAGTREARQSLSEERAAVIARFFLENGVREETEMVIQGKGAREPVDTNDTPEGRRKNRRVEIIILEN